MAPRFALVGLTLALLANTGCTSSDASEMLTALATDLARQLATFWLL